MNMLAPFVEHWGYAAILAVVVLGNVGLPVPEEAILTLSGYLVWRGDLRLWLVLSVGIVSASAGDNLGYWLGRRLGGAAIRRYGRRVWLTPAKLDTAQGFVQKYGALAVFVARFLPGLRFAAGPVAGLTGMRAPVFFLANALGACLYVPAMVGVGYAVGHRAGSRLEQAGRALVRVEYVVLAAMVLVTALALLLRARRQRRMEAEASEG
jgi:membrane protein DedA with SNARE-associated domain